MKKKIVIIVILLGGCALPEKNQPKPPAPHYSTETENEFLEIENSTSPYSKQTKDAADRYRRLREQSWDNYTKKSKSNYQPKKYQHIRKEYKQSKKPTYKIPVLTKEQQEELNIQSNQMMSYFCMKNRNKNNCKEYTNSVFKNCKKRNNGRISKSVVRCLKSKLRV